MNNASVANAPADTAKINTGHEDTSKDVLKPTPENNKETNNKHVLTYIGSSEYTDSTGHKWHKNDEQTYSDADYNKRKDLHFMVKYGEMKHTVVTM